MALCGMTTCDSSRFPVLRDSPLGTARPIRGHRARRLRASVGELSRALLPTINLRAGAFSPSHGNHARPALAIGCPCRPPRAWLAPHRLTGTGSASSLLQTTDRPPLLGNSHGAPRARPPFGPGWMVTPSTNQPAPTAEPSPAFRLRLTPAPCSAALASPPAPGPARANVSCEIRTALHYALVG
jgi:hypothetical protein